jgi:hypothetical protein
MLEAPGLSFIICYCPQLEVLRDWFLLVHLEIGRPDNSYYFSLRLHISIDRPSKGSRVDFRSQNQAVLSQWGPWCWYWAIFCRGDLRLAYEVMLHEPDGRLEQILCEHSWRGPFTA